MRGQAAGGVNRGDRCRQAVAGTGSVRGSTPAPAFALPAVGGAFLGGAGP